MCEHARGVDPTDVDIETPNSKLAPTLYGGTTRNLVPVTRPNDEGPDLDNDLGCLVHTDSSV